MYICALWNDSMHFEMTYSRGKLFCINMKLISTIVVGKDEENLIQFAQIHRSMG